MGPSGRRHFTTAKAAAFLLGCMLPRVADKQGHQRRVVEFAGRGMHHLRCAPAFRWCNGRQPRNAVQYEMLALIAVEFDGRQRSIFIS